MDNWFDLAIYVSCKWKSLQITKYEKSGFYGWHRDGTGSHDEIFTDPSNEFLYGNTRKLSMSLILNSDFEGGDFEVFPRFYFYSEVVLRLLGISCSKFEVTSS